LRIQINSYRIDSVIISIEGWIYQLQLQATVKPDEVMAKQDTQPSTENLFNIHSQISLLVQPPKEYLGFGVWKS